MSIENPVVLATEFPTVVLRELTTQQDAVAYRMAIESNVAHLSQFGDETAAKYPTLASVENSIFNPPNPTKLRLGIWSVTSFLGTVNMTPNEDGSEAEVGYWLDARRQGRGYATVAVKSLAAYANQRFDRVYAHVHPDNDRSAAVLTRAGFEPADQEGDNVVFELPDPTMEYAYPDLPESFLSLYVGDSITGIDTGREVDEFEQKMATLLEPGLAVTNAWMPKKPLSAEMRPPKFNGELRNTRALVEEVTPEGVTLTLVTSLHSTGRGEKGLVARRVTYKQSPYVVGRVTRKLEKRSGELSSDKLGAKLVAESAAVSRKARVRALRRVLPGGLPS